MKRLSVLLNENMFFLIIYKKYFTLKNTDKISLITELRAVELKKKSVNSFPESGDDFHIYLVPSISFLVRGA